MGILVYDFGGSAVKYGYWNGQQLEKVDQFPTSSTWKEMKADLYKVFFNIKKQVPIEGVGISAPGVVNGEKKMIEGISAIPYIHRFNIFKELENLFQLPVTIENDATCAGMAEFYEGAAKDQQDAAFVVIGTGIGGALFTKGQLLKGAHLYGGEFGLMFLENDKTFSELGTAVHMAFRYCKRKGVDKMAYSGKEVFRLAEEGDKVAQEEVNAFYDYLTKGLFSIQFSFDPEVIVLGGGVSAREGLIEEINQRMVLLLKKHGLCDFVPQIVLCNYRNDANLVGAAANYFACQQREV